MHNYRCTRSGCRKRYSLKKHPNQSVREKRCRCGGRLAYDPEVKRRSRKQVCHCDGVHYPHRQGSVPSCYHADVDPEAAYAYLKETYTRRYKP